MVFVRTAKVHYLETRCKGVTLAEVFGVTFGAACKWIREWKREELLQH